MEKKNTSPINKDNINNNNNINNINNINININNNINNNNEIQSFNQDIINESSENKIIEKISDLFSDICDENNKDYQKEKNNLIKPFISMNPSISIKDYLERLYKYCRINISTIILVLIYIDRICNINKFKLTYYNIHKLILSSMVVAIKYNEESYYSIIFYAKIGGVSKTEMINLEYNFVTLIKFNLFVKEDLFKKYNDYICSNESEEEESDEPYEDENTSEKSDNNNKDNNNNINIYKNDNNNNKNK